MQMKDSNKCFK